MRPLQLFLTASGFALYVVVMVCVSAMATSVVHSTLSPRPNLWIAPS